MSEVACPVCGKTCEEVVDEVDIGAGIMRNVRGYDCPACGQLAVCFSCGALDGHFSWCKETNEIHRKS